MDFNKTIASIPDRFPLKVFPELGVTVTGKSLRHYSGICAAWLQKQGFGTIALHMGNCPEFLYLFAGALRAGVKVQLLNVLEPAETDFSVFDRDRVAAVIDNPPETFIPHVWKTDEPFLVMYTSGTSGERKQVEKGIVQFFAKGHPPIHRGITRLLGLRVYNSSPWYHQLGLCLLIYTLSGIQLTEITAERFNPEQMRMIINETRPNALFTTPTMLTRCIDCGEFRLPAFIVCSGERLSDRTLAQLERNGGGKILVNSYGTTETYVIAGMNYLFDRVGLFGRILILLKNTLPSQRSVSFNRKTLPPHCAGSIVKTVDVRIMKDGKKVGEGEPGEIHARTRTMVASLGEGYFNTGDIGYVKDGLLFVIGRRTNVINRSGEKILPEDIERVIAGRPGVRSVVVFGIPSETHGEDICAAVESEDGSAVFAPSDLEGSLPKYKIPQHLFFYSRFPLTVTGKTDLSVLRAEAMKKVARP